MVMIKVATPYQNVAKTALINWNAKDPETTKIIATRHNGGIKL